MYEIELKAHVYDRKGLIRDVSSFARYAGTVCREDTYYKFQKQDGQKISARIRNESPVSTGEIALPNPVQPAVLLTYKRKEIKTDVHGASIEVNDEKECALSDRTALEALLTDTGYKFSHSKIKTVIDFKYLEATIEIVTIEKLGDFVEIEIISEKNDAETVKKYQKSLRDILRKCNIPESQIEERYYSDMLRDLKS